MDHASLSQDRLDLAARTRTSLFPWRGQFSPELVEVLLSEYAPVDATVLDPFVGSGTTLFEAARRCLGCVGAEINPAAVTLASTAAFANVPPADRLHYARAARCIVEKHMPEGHWGGLFASTALTGSGPGGWSDALAAMVTDAASSPLIHNLVANAVLRFMERGNREDGAALMGAFDEHWSIVEQLPFTPMPCTVLHCDARALPVSGEIADLVVTSPPYINVFNYHQNHRTAMELMGWDVLCVARSEVGANRKHRSNRFLTVVQYAIDMMQALAEMRRLTRPGGRIIVVVGRESSVRGISFQNGRILAALALGGAGLRLALRQEREFKTKFGEVIYEDIIHFDPVAEPPSGPTREALARSIGRQALTDVLPNARGTVRDDITRAIRESSLVRPSPPFLAGAATRRKQHAWDPTSR